MIQNEIDSSIGVDLLPGLQMVGKLIHNLARRQGQLAGWLTFVRVNVNFRKKEKKKSGEDI